MHKLMEVAAAAGHMHVCSWLRELGCPWGHALRAAAGAGKTQSCEQLLAGGCPCDSAAVYAAAAAAHQEPLALHLRSKLPDGAVFSVVDYVHNMLVGLARDSDLASLQAFHHARQESERQEAEQFREQVKSRHGVTEWSQLDRTDAAQAEEQLTQKLNALQPSESQFFTLVSVAARSPTADWQAKVVWIGQELRPRYVPLDRRHGLCTRVAGMPDAAERLRWLVNHCNYQVAVETAEVAASTGNVPALQYLVEEAGVEAPGASVATRAAAGGHLAAVQYLHRRGIPVDARGAIGAAAWSGHLEMVQWLVRELQVGPADLQTWAADLAVGSDNMQLLEWMWEQGCRWVDGPGPGALRVCARAGCEEVMEWLVAAGCPLPADGTPYVEPAANGDLATLRCLRRLGCPWGPEATFTNCVRRAAPLPVLRWMVEAGCPVDWSQAMQVALAKNTAKNTAGPTAKNTAGPTAKNTELVMWLEEESNQRAQE